MSGVHDLSLSSIDELFNSSNWQSFLNPICHLLQILNLFVISHRGEAVNYRPYAACSFEEANHAK